MRREQHISETGAAGRSRVEGERHAPGGGGGRREQVMARLAEFRGSRRTRFLGVPEIVALLIACALLATAAAAYFLLYVPERSRLADLENERQRLQTQIRSAGENREHDRSTADSVSRILQTLTSFESDALEPREASIRDLIQELNDKSKRAGLSRAQFSFIYQDDTQTGAAQQSQQRAAGNLAGTARRRQNVFPATDISLSVEGTYANLRRFLRDVELSRRFLVINGVQLEGINETGADAAAARGALVSLRLDMSAYFRRSGAAAATTADANGATATTRRTSQ
ncbi:MAG: GspMb/PilO family protein [Pyrinomonadaceae bacterium]